MVFVVNVSCRYLINSMNALRPKLRDRESAKPTDIISKVQLLLNCVSRLPLPTILSEFHKLFSNRETINGCCSAELQVGCLQSSYDLTDGT